MTFIVHPHFHRRRTGVTRHVEDVVQSLQPEAFATGDSLSPSTPQLPLKQACARMRRESMSIWHAHRVNELLVGLLLRSLTPKRIRVVFTRHSATVASWWTKLWARKADRVIALTEHSRLEPSDTIIGHGVDTTVFSPPRSRADAWSSLNFGGRRGIGVIGRIRPAKGQGDFVNAIAPLLPQYPEWKAVLIGTVKSAERDWAKTLSAHVTLVGEQATIAPWYQGLSVLVQPSHSEGFSLVVLEAMASGCCVIAARLPHFSNIIEHGRTGLLYEPGDFAALRAHVASVMSNPDKATRMGDAARAEVVARFGLEREIASLRAVYDSFNLDADFEKIRKPSAGPCTSDS